MFVLKCLRVRLIIFLFLLTLIWITFYYFLKTSPKELTQTSEMLILKRDTPILDIAVYYECLCPDSRSFFVRQLLPAVEKIPSLLNIDYVPYGKAQTEEIGPSKYRFKCQHGPPECLGNKIHACVITRVSDELKRAEILTCMIAGKVNPEESGRKCANDYNLDWNSIWHCANGSEGDELLKLHGDKTNSLSPKVIFIPTILIDHDLGSQAAILKDFWKQICLKYEQMGRIIKECTVN